MECIGARIDRSHTAGERVRRSFVRLPPKLEGVIGNAAALARVVPLVGMEVLRQWILIAPLRHPTHKAGKPSQQHRAFTYAQVGCICIHIFATPKCVDDVLLLFTLVRQIWPRSVCVSINSVQCLFVACRVSKLQIDRVGVNIRFEGGGIYALNPPSFMTFPF